MSLQSDNATELKSLSLEKKLGHMIMGRGLRLYPDEVRVMIQEGRMANLQAGSGGDEQTLIAELQHAQPLPMLIGADMENGFESGSDGTDLPYPMALGAIDDEQAAYEWAAIGAREARAYGVNMVYGPVLDAAIVPESPMVNIRAISSDWNVIIRLGAAIIRGYQDHGMIVAAKHYPGAGRSPVDNHIEQCRLPCNQATFEREELRVYAEINRRVPLSGVMSGHIFVPSIDANYMATVSPSLVNALRKAGFNGVLMTDSLAMKGLKSFVKADDLLPKVLASGHDLILIDYNQSPEQQYGQLLKAVQVGRVSIAAIDASVRRILQAKRHIARVPVSAVDRQAHRATGLSLNRRAITVTGPFASWQSSGWNSNTLIIIAAEQKTAIVQGEVRSDSRSGIEALIRKQWPASQVLSVSNTPSPSEMERILDATLGFDRVVFITYALPHSYAGTADLSRPLLAMISGLQSKINCLVLFGNPYAARHLPPLPVIMYPYWGGQAELAAVETLAGHNCPTGKLPVQW